MSIIDDMQQRGNRLIPQSEIDRMKRESRAMSEAMERQLPIEEQRRRRSEAATAAREREDAEWWSRLAKWDEDDRKEREARDAACEAARVERTQAKEKELKERLRAAYLETPGATEAGFAKVWPKLLEQHQIEQTIAAVPTREKLIAEFKALRGSGPDFHERPLPQPIEE